MTPPPMPVPWVTITKSSTPRPAPHSCSHNAAQFASFSQNTRADATHEARQSDADRHFVRAESLARDEVADLFGQHLGGRRARGKSPVVGRGGLDLAQDAPVARHDEAQGLGPTNVDADCDVAHARRSARAFNSPSAWVWIRWAARAFTKAGIGTRSSTSRS